MNKLKYFIFWVLVPFILFGFWIIIPVITISHSALSVIASSYDKSIYTPFKSGEIQKGEVINAGFKARENNLGIVAVRFNTFGRINSDSVIFRIKEKGDAEWYYIGKYKVDQFQPDDFFTFGFPRISNSQNKVYVFQIESTRGEEGDAVALSNIEPVAMAKYQFTKTELLSNKTILPVFAYKKIFYSFSDFGFFVSSLPFLLPLIFYILSLRYKSHIFKNRYPLYLYMFTVVLFVYLFLLQLLPGVSSLVLLASWIFLIFLNRFEAPVSFLYALVLLSIMPFLLFFSQILTAENFAIWTYYFLVVGTIQSVYEFKKHPKNLMTYQEVIKDFIPVQMRMGK